MTRTLSIYGLTEDECRTLKARAAQEGVSMSDYLKRLIERDLKRPSWAEMTKRMDALKPVALSMTTAGLVRFERDGR